MNDITQTILAGFRGLDLNYNDLQGDGIIKLKREVDLELQRLRERNDSSNLGPEATARLRGHIECLKALKGCLAPNEPPATS